MANRIARSIYRSIPFKKELYKSIKKIGTPSFYEKLAFKGAFIVKINEEYEFKMYNDYDLVLEKVLFWKGLSGGWEKISLEVWTRLAKHAKVIFDCGANSGVYSLMAETINKNADVYAFEPIGRNIELLKDNKNINGYKFEIVECAVSDHDGFCSMFQMPGVVNYMTSVNNNRYTSNEKVIEVKVPTKRLSTFIAEKNIKKVDLIKLDVEEHELEVLIEIIGNEKAREIQKICDPLGYFYYYIDEINPPVKTDNLVDNDHHNYLICTNEVAKLLGL
jgi:FkbM family methyltransferase